MVLFGTGAVLGASLMYSSIVPTNDGGGWRKRSIWYQSSEHPYCKKMNGGGRNSGLFSGAKDLFQNWKLEVSC